MAALNPKGDLDLTARERLLAGGQSKEPAVVPGHSKLSSLVRLVRTEVEDLEMPPISRRTQFPALTEAQIQMLVECG